MTTSLFGFRRIHFRDLLRGSSIRNSQSAIRNLLLSLLLCLLVPSIAGAENRILKLTPDAGPVIGGTVVRISLEELAILGDLEVRFGNRIAAKVFEHWAASHSISRNCSAVHSCFWWL